MSTLREKFEKFEPEPDPRVWRKISNRLRRPRRLAIMGTAAAATIAAAGMLYALTHKDAERGEQRYMARVEQNVKAEQRAERIAEKASQDVFKEVKKEGTQETITEPKEQIHEAATVTDMTEMPEMAEANVEKIEKERATATEETITVMTPQPAAETNRKTVEAERQEAKSTEVNEMKTKEISARSTAKTPSPKSANDSLVVWIPNAFAPDDMDAGDKVRQFRVYPNNEANLLTFEMYIYSRTGRMVFHTTDIEKAWDGTANGKAQPMGTYVYVIQLNDAVKGLQRTKGTITLIR